MWRPRACSVLVLPFWRVGHRGGPVPLDHDLVGEGPADDVQVGPAVGGAEVAHSGGHPHAVHHVLGRRADALRHPVVVVVHPGQAAVLGRSQELLLGGYEIVFGRPADGDGPTGAVEAGAEEVGAERVVFQPAEARGHGLPRPVGAGPGVVVAGHAPQRHPAVHRRPPAQRPALGVGGGGVAGGAGLKAPVAPGMREVHRAQPVGVGVGLNWPGLQQQHRGARVLRQPGGQHRSGGAPADDHEVVDHGKR